MVKNKYIKIIKQKKLEIISNNSTNLLYMNVKTIRNTNPRHFWRYEHDKQYYEYFIIFLFIYIQNEVSYHE